MIDQLAAVTATLEAIQASYDAATKAAASILRSVASQLDALRAENRALKDIIKEKTNVERRESDQTPRFSTPRQSGLHDGDGSEPPRSPP